MSKRNIILVCANIVLATLLFTWWSSLQIPAPTKPYSEHSITFNLHNDQKPVSEAILQNKVGLILLGDMHCPDACPALLMRMRLSLTQFSDSEREKIKALFIDLQPNAKALEVAKLARFFHPDIIGLHGNNTQLQTMVQTASFQQSLKQLQQEHPHTFVIVRPDGYVAAHLSHAADTTTIVSALRTWLTWAQ